MWALAVLTSIFVITFLTLLSIGKRTEIIKNWDKYRNKPLYMMTAFAYKPDDDPRSRFEFMQDNFRKNMQALVVQTFKVVMAPMFDIFQITGGGVVGSMKGTSNIQSIIAVMMESFNQIFSIFDNRFKATLYQFTSTYRRLHVSMERIWAVTVASIYQSLSTISAMLSTIDLVIKIVITILVILVGIVIFLFLFMWPVIPVILTVIGVIVTAGMGAAVGGMAETFCFAANTQIQMADGTTRPIQEVKIGDLLTTGKVTACMEFLQSSPLYELHGVRVTGTHIVWYKNAPIHVADHPDAVLLQAEEPLLYCLNTESQRIPVLSSAGILLFADWEELSDEDQMPWNEFVFRTLNPGKTWNAEDAVIAEAGFAPSTLIQTPLGPVPIESLRPGTNVLDEKGVTRVLGVVELEEAALSAVWREIGGCWKQGLSGNTGKGYALVTESGTYLTPYGAVRDFTDVGSALSDSYDWVLNALRKTGA